MIKFRSLSLSVLLILSLGFISCINVKPVELKEVKNISVESIKDNELNLELELMISNPNNKQFLVREADLSISMGEVTLGKLNEVEEFVIPARSSNSYKVPLKIDLENVEKNARQLTKSIFKKGTTIQITGYIKARAFLISKKIEIDEKTKISLLKSLFG